MTASNFVLLHSPLVGPLTWKGVAAQLEEKGHRVAAPDLTGALVAGPPYWETIARCVRLSVEGAGLDGSLVLVAHSAAGAYLAAIRAALDRAEAALYVDARLPNPGKSLFDSGPPAMADSIRALAREDWLPPWHEWFGEAAMREVLPDAGLLQEFVAELLPIPLDMFEEPIPGPAGWNKGAAGYIQFGKVYEPEAKQARELGWPTIRLDGRHLHMLIEPAAVADAILELLSQH
jgi:hypothetical protein